MINEAGNLTPVTEELLLHPDERIHATLQKVRNCLGRGPIPNSFLHTGHENFILFLSQFEKNFLPFEEVVDAVTSNFAENSSGRVMRIRQLLPDGMHNAGILPHRKIQENALCCEETLHTLLGPPRQ